MLKLLNDTAIVRIRLNVPLETMVTCEDAILYCHIHIYRRFRMRQRISLQHSMLVCHYEASSVAVFVSSLPPAGLSLKAMITVVLLYTDKVHKRGGRDC